MENFKEKGRWANAEWRLFTSGTIPNEDNVTAVFGIPFHTDGLVMIKNHNRGWELPGGHREIGESLKETLAREILEEAGIRHFESSREPVGYLEIMNDIPKINKATGEDYPNPAYILFYAVKTEEPLEQFCVDEALDCNIFSLDNLPEIESDNLKIYLKHFIPLAKDYFLYRDVKKIIK
ncbi:MAG: NUDIX domain-containing protein [Candidatus Paceibacterota bacterium]